MIHSPCGLAKSDFSSEILRRAAESTMHEVVRTVFARLFDLDPAIEESKLQSSTGEDDSELKLSTGTGTVSSVPENTPTESGMSIDSNADQNTLPPSSAALERTECMSRVKSEQPTY